MGGASYQVRINLKARDAAAETFETSEFRPTRKDPPTNEKLAEWIKLAIEEEVYDAGDHYDVSVRSERLDRD